MCTSRQFHSWVGFLTLLARPPPRGGVPPLTKQSTHVWNLRPPPRPPVGGGAQKRKGYREHFPVLGEVGILWKIIKICTTFWTGNPKTPFSLNRAVHKFRTPRGSPHDKYKHVHTCFTHMHKTYARCSTSHTTFAHMIKLCADHNKYPSGPARWQPWPPSFACAKAVTTGAGFIERQRLQFDMSAPLGRTSCFCNETTVT